MKADAAMLEGVLKERGICAAALFSADKSVVHRGFDGTASRIVDVAAAARHVFRETKPAIRALDLKYESGRILILSLSTGEGILVVRVEAGAVVDIEHLLAGLAAWSTVEPPASPTMAPASAPRADATTERLRIAVEAANLVSVAARKSIGGPVIRNYMRKAQGDVRETFPEIDRFTVDLEGRVTIGGSVDGLEDNLEASVAAWLAAFLTRAMIVAPELGTSTLASMLEPLGGKARGIVESARPRA